MNKPECRIDEHNGVKEWLLDGEFHREDGPAIEWSDGTIQWYLNGKCHREDGPAWENPNGAKEWYLNGNQIHPEVLVDLWLAKNIYCIYNKETNSLEFE